MQDIHLSNFVYISSDSTFSAEKMEKKKIISEFTVYTMTDKINEPYLTIRQWAQVSHAI